MLALYAEALRESCTNRKILFSYVIISTLTNLFRPNMIYAALLWLIPLLIAARKQNRVLVLCTFLSIVLAWGSNELLKNALHAVPGNTLQEILNWPAQQLARVRLRQPEVFTEDETLAMDEIIVKKKWREYNPYLSDPVKGAIDTDVLLSNPKRYIDLYLSIGKKCPQLYFDAGVELCYVYLYPYQDYRLKYDYVETGIDYSSFAKCYGSGRIIENSRFTAVRNWLRQNIWKDGALHIPVLRWVLNMGAIVWLMLFFLLREAYCGQWQRFTLYLLPVILWLMYLFGPIMYSRYLYSIICSLPVMAASPRKTESQPLNN